MGLLGDIFSFGNTVKRNVKGLLADPSGTLEQWGDQAKNYGNNVVPTISGGLLDNRQMTEAEQMQKYMELASVAPIGMTVWHGSPHKFSKFDMSKIGTGEGAQAYGHGLYMAEAPEVANAYRENLSDRVFKIGGKELRGPATRYGVADPGASRGDMSMPEKIATYALDSAARGKSADPARDAIAHLKKNGKGNPDAQLAIEMIQKWVDEGANLEQGALYKVDIPDEAVARFLDWDKPLSQQAPEVLDALSKMKDVKHGSWSLGDTAETISAAKQYGIQHILDDPKLNIDGSALLQVLGGSVGRPSVEATDMLRKTGVQGIRYLDGGSRSAGQGSSNFVLFSDQLPRILEINGQATGLQPWAKGEWRGLLD